MEKMSETLLMNQFYPTDSLKIQEVIQEKQAY